MRCFTQQTTGSATARWLDDATPVISAENTLYYYNLDAALDAANPGAAIAGRIRAVAANRAAPAFIICYGGVGPGLFDIIAGVQQSLPADQFEVVGADHFCDLARQAGALSAECSSLGVEPGGTLDLDLALRNPGPPRGAAASLHSAAGVVTLALPEGWSASASEWRHDAVAPGECLRHRIQLTAAATPGPASIVATDSRDGTTRASQVSIYAGSTSLADFTPEGLWRSTGAALRFEDGKAIITTPETYASVARSVTVDFDRGPLIEINVAHVEGTWAMKVNDGTLPVDISLQPDSGTTGHHTYDLSSACPNWTGTKQVQLYLFAIGQGKSLTVDNLRLHYRR